MEPENDPQLNELLREWRVSDAPVSLDKCVLSLQRPWWSFVLTGSIRIPVPVGIAIAAAVLAMAIALFRERPPQPVSTSISLVEFRPVSDLNIRVIAHHETH